MGIMMETHNHLSLEWCKQQFLAKPNTRIARWYLAALLRHRAAGLIDDVELMQGMEEIKLWQKEGQKG